MCAQTGLLRSMTGCRFHVLWKGNQRDQISTVKVIQLVPLNYYQLQQCRNGWYCRHLESLSVSSGQNVVLVAPLVARTTTEFVFFARCLYVCLSVDRFC